MTAAIPRTKICVIGLGYVGLPLAIQFAKAGVHVVGLDIDATKVEAINTSASYLRHIPAAAVAEQRRAGLLEASTDFQRVAEAEASIICVPTPLTKQRDPDLSFVLNTARAIAPHLRKGALVVLESTTYPGTTEEELRPVLEAGSGLVAGVDFHLAFSPEREDPGNPQSRIGDIPKIVGGLTSACRDRAVALYSLAVGRVVPVSSCRVAEAAKLLENIFRGVNIALVNELKVIYERMGIDIWEVVEAAKTKPFGFMPFYPGPGLGGHCIPIDPFYLTWKARAHGLNTRFIELAGEINTAMPLRVVDRAAEALNDAGRPLKGSRVLIVGLAYKGNVDDCRESPSFVIMETLRDRGAHVAYHDPHIPKIPVTREHAAWAGQESVAWSQTVLSSFDIAIIVTAHNAVDHQLLGQSTPMIVDTRNVMAALGPGRAKIWKA